MNPAKIGLIFGSIFVSLLVAAFCWDSVNTLSRSYEEVAAVDKEVARQEKRYIETLKQLTSPGTAESLISSYLACTTPDTRTQAFDAITDFTNHTVSAQIDPTNPIKRPLLDELAGAINRRKVALAELTTRADNYNKLALGSRGKIAQTFSSLPEAWGQK